LVQSKQSNRGSGPEGAGGVLPGRAVVLALGAWLVLGATLAAADRVELTLSEAFERALRANRALAVSRVRPEIARSQVTIEQGQFDRKLTAELQRRVNEVPTATLLSGRSVSRADYDLASLGVSQQTHDGTELQMQWLNRRDSSNAGTALFDPAYTSNLVLSVVHPLSRNSGKQVVTARLKAAQLDEEAARIRLEAVAQALVASVEKSFVELTSSRKDLEVKELALQDARKLVTYHTSRREAGISSRANILEAESVAALREEDVLLARRAVAEAQDTLVTLLSWNELAAGAELVCADGPGVSLPGSELQTPPAYELLLETALRQRPDYRSASRDARSRELLARAARSQKDPRVDLVAAHQFNGLEGNLGGSVGDSLSEGHASWGLGLSVEVSLDNRAARGEFERRQLEHREAQLALGAIEDAARKELTVARRRILTDQERIGVAQRAEELAAQKLATEEGRFHEGLLQNVELLRFQEDLAEARSRLVRARADLARSWVELDQSVGLVLERRGIRWSTATELLPVARRFDRERQPFLQPPASSLNPQSGRSPRGEVSK
jgi:outer membrane protein TolC